jgi:hypothetical protein
MKKTKPFSLPTDAEVAAYAYHLWEAEGCASGRDLDYWFQAKAHLVADRLYEAGMLDQLTPTLLKRPDAHLLQAPKQPGSPPAKSSPRRFARRTRSIDQERAAA